MADYSASNQLKLSELNAHRVGNDLPAITMKELISRESNGIRVDVGLPDESFDGLTFNPKFVIDRPSNKSVSQKLKSNQANMNALFDIRQDELAYVQDREFGTYENNLTEQTVNAEAEKIFAEQNQIRDALNTELVQKHNDSLKPTYSPGDKVSAAQMQNKTYGLGVNPGEETSFIDQTSDKYGRSEQNVEKADAYQAKLEAERAHVAQTSITADEIAPVSSGQLASDDALLDEGALIGLTTIQLSPEDIEDNVDEQTGSDVAIESFETHQKVITDEVLKVTASDTAVRNSLANSAEILKQRKIEAEDARQNQRIEDIANKSDEAAADVARELSAANFRNEFNAKRGSETYFALNDDENAALLEADKISNKDGVLKSQYLQTLKAGEETEILGQTERDTVLSDVHPDEYPKSLNELAAEHIADEKLAEAKKAVVEEKALSEKKSEIAKKAAATTKELQAKELVEIEAKRQNDKIDNMASRSDAAAAAAAANTPESVFKSQASRNRKIKEEKAQAAKAKKSMETADRIGGKQDRDNDRSKDPLAFMAGDPYAFSSLSYPYNVTNSNENGHYILFYVNVQNKTKYLYNTPQVGVTVGDYIEKPGYYPSDDTNIPPSERASSNNFINSGEASRQGGAAAGPISYQSQTIKNGGKGNILRNNMFFLQKSRKAPYAGINSRYPTTTRITDSVALYLPTGIGNTTTATYGDSETGVAGYLALSGLDIIQDVQDLDFAGATDKLFGVGGTLIKEAVKKIGIKSLQALTETEGLTESFDKIFGQTLNPYIEVTYTSFGMRTFDYTFQFAPESARESDEVKAIIQLFRFHMAPEMKGDAHRYLTLPSTFDIHYMFQSGMGDEAVAKENSFYNKIATCVLTSVDVNYTPNEGVKSFADGAPTQLSMALSFKETEMLTKQKINDGF